MMAANNLNTLKETSLGFAESFRIFWRSFFIQAVWNYRSMISIGFGICLLPLMRRLYPEPEAQRAFLLRHFKFFNSHPYMASYALGVSARLEEAIAAGDEEAVERLPKVKELMISLLGARGDQLFWCILKPFSLLAGLCGLLLVSSTVGRAIVLLLTLLIYNVPHFYIRYIGIREGYQYGIDVYKCLYRERFRTLKRVYTWLGAISFAGIAGIVLFQYLQVDTKMVVAFAISGGSAFLSDYFTGNSYLTLFLGAFMGLVAGVFL